MQCAQQIQAQLRTHNAEQEKAEQIHVRIGIHLGDVVQRDGDVFGDGVNIASRLQSLAEPDTICISQVVYQRGRQEIGPRHGGLAGQTQAEEHRRTVPGLCPVARATHRLAPAIASPAPETLASSAACAPAGSGWAATHRGNTGRRPVSSPFSLASNPQHLAPSPCPCPTNPPLSCCPSPT